MNAYATALADLDRLTDVIAFVQTSIKHIPDDVRVLPETNYDDHIRPLIAADYVLAQAVSDLGTLYSDLVKLQPMMRK